MTLPDIAETVFGDRLPLAERFAEWLTGPGIVRGLLGPSEADQIWIRHVLNGVGIASLIAAGSVVIDLGSGAGLPGVPLVLARPDLQVVLVEPKARRAEFLREVCADLGLATRVARARATPAGLVLLPEGTSAPEAPPADVVTARAVASIANLGSWAVPLLRPGGRVLAVKGATAEAELDRDERLLRRLGFEQLDVLAVPPVPGTGHRAASAHGTATVVSMTLTCVSRET
ncbi:MAG: 16S rRNA (guanine(527)-N(7))-methyltransferase RsmG [Actinomycetota bacterium]|nr:16S rRNA (guanine(527)-N(7))-methyltransferase RsmG [Actinomycetota bacterium]